MDYFGHGLYVLMKIKRRQSVW